MPLVHNYVEAHSAKWESCSARFCISASRWSAAARGAPGPAATRAGRNALSAAAAACISRSREALCCMLAAFAWRLRMLAFATNVVALCILLT
jgi:hypothetical protein